MHRLIFHVNFFFLNTPYLVFRFTSYYQVKKIKYPCIDFTLFLKCVFLHCLPGVNLRTSQSGIFPSMYATDLEFLEEEESKFNP